MDRLSLFVELRSFTAVSLNNIFHIYSGICCPRLKQMHWHGYTSRFQDYFCTNICKPLHLQSRSRCSVDWSWKECGLWTAVGHPCAVLLADSCLNVAIQLLIITEISLLFTIEELLRPLQIFYKQSSFLATFINISQLKLFPQSRS